VSTIDDLTRDYRAALLRFLPAQAEDARATGYDIGRRAVEDGVGLLDLAQVHHRVLVEVMEQTGPDDCVAVARTASEFLLDVLSTYDMAHRGLREERVARPVG
jgi:Phosphoserine phosphatase RsbU, N-terminal domain